MSSSQPMPSESPKDAVGIKFGYVPPLDPIAVSPSMTEDNISVSKVRHLKNESVKPALENLCLASRTKREGWHCQDYAAVSFLKHDVTEDDLKKAYQKAVEETDELKGGSTATTVVITPTRILVAWKGDSPAFLTARNKNTGEIIRVQGLNEPHLPVYDYHRLDAELAKIDKDGRLDRKKSLPDQKNNYSLSMSRAFGNNWLNGVLIREPSIVTLSREGHEGKEINLGSDGILTASERELMFPRPNGASITPQDKNLLLEGQPVKGAHFKDKTVINYCAERFAELARTASYGSGYADAIVTRAQEGLGEMEAEEDKSLVGYAAVDDTTFMSMRLLENFPYTIVMTVADGHRDGGEVTSKTAADVIHAKLADIDIDNEINAYRSAKR